MGLLEKLKSMSALVEQEITHTNHLVYPRLVVLKICAMAHKN